MLNCEMFTISLIFDNMKMKMKCLFHLWFNLFDLEFFSLLHFLLKPLTNVSFFRSRNEFKANFYYLSLSNKGAALYGIVFRF